MSYLRIELTAPEVHPPQCLELINGTDGYRWGTYEDGTLACILETWHSDFDFVDGFVIPQYGWYLGWAFADIAREAKRLENEFYDNLLRWRYAHGV